MSLVQKTRKPAHCGDRLALRDLTFELLHSAQSRASSIPIRWISELERLEREYQRTGQKRFLLAAIIHQRGIIARLEKAVRL